MNKWLMVVARLPVAVVLGRRALVVALATGLALGLVGPELAVVLGLPEAVELCASLFKRCLGLPLQD